MADLLYLLPIVLAVVLAEVVLLWVRHCFPTWRGASKTGAQLPKGSFGWPIIGETLAFAQNPPAYAAAHVKRYGKIFKTSIASQQLIMGTTPAFAKFVVSNSNIFTSSAPASLMNIIGPETIMFKDGPLHMSLKKLLQKAILPESLRSQVNALETIVLENLVSWEQAGTIIAKEATDKITLDTGMWMLTGVRDIAKTPTGRTAQENFERLNGAIFAIPVNLPGTAYNKGLKARADLTQYFKHVIKERRCQDNTQADVLGVLLAAQKDPQASDEVKDIDDNVIAENLVLMWFAARDTTATTLAWVLKLLVDNPDVLSRVQAEQREILKSKEQSGEAGGLSWEDTKNMVYTTKFFQEVQRYLSISPIVSREATQDIEYEGHLIPKGWGVRPLLTFLHADPAVYPDPKSFNPDRFDVAPKPYTFLPFFAGPHMCPGMDLAKLISLIFIHHITTTYTYEAAGPDKGVQYSFFPGIVGGYPIKIRRQT